MWRCRTCAAGSRRETQPFESLIQVPQVCLNYTLSAQDSLWRSECIRAQNQAKQPGATARLFSIAPSPFRRGMHTLGLAKRWGGLGLKTIRSFAYRAATELGVSR